MSTLPNKSNGLVPFLSPLSPTVLFIACRSAAFSILLVSYNTTGLVDSLLVVTVIIHHGINFG